MTAMIGGRERPLRPSYWVGSNNQVYLYIPMAGDFWIVEKDDLFDNLVKARMSIESGWFTPESIAPLAGPVADGIAVYMDQEALTADVVAANAALAAALAGRVEIPGAVNTTALAAKIASAKAILPAFYTWDSFADLQSAIVAAETFMAVGAIAGVGVINVTYALDIAVWSLVHIDDIDRSALQAIIDVANTRLNPANDGVKEWAEHEFTAFTRKSWNAFVPLRAEALKVLVNDPKNFNQSEVNDMARRLGAADGGLLNYVLADERDCLRAAIDELIAINPLLYNGPSQKRLAEWIAWGEDRYVYASLTFIERDGIKEDIRDIIDNHLFTPVTSVNIEAAMVQTVLRGMTVNFNGKVNSGSSSETLVWAVSSDAFATVDAATGSVSILNRVGTVTLTAKCSETNVSTSIVLRII